MAAPVGAPPLVELRGLRAGYGAIEVLHGVDLAVAGRVGHALLGPNGAGKTTTLRTLAGLHPATAGEILLAGRRVNGGPADDLSRAGLCLVPEGRGVFPNLTVRENLRVATHAGRPWPRSRRTPSTASRGWPSARPARRHPVRAASSRCWPWPGRWRRGPVSCSSTSCRWGWRRSWCRRSTTRWLASPPRRGRHPRRRAVRPGGPGGGRPAAVLVGGRVVAAGTPADLEGSLTELYLGSGT